MGSFATVWIVLQLVIVVRGSAHPCQVATEWSDGNTKYRIVPYKGQKYVHVRCLQGFIPERESLISCVEGNVPEDLPLCSSTTRVGCGNLFAPINGRMNCVENPPLVNSRCIFSCDSTHYLKGSEARICTANLVWTGSAASCHKKAECQVPPPLEYGTVIDCSPEKKPFYKDKCSFRCNDGFTLNGPGQLTCSLSGKLVDEWGRETSPQCVRNNSAGLSATAAKLHIFERVQPALPDTCDSNRKYCSHKCEMNNGVVECSCPTGYRLHQDNRTCVDIDECREGTHHCEHNCHNLAGEYTCSCRLGYDIKDIFHCREQSWLAKHRDNVALRNKSTPCQVNNGGCHHLCNDHNGAVQCRCKDGYDLAKDGLQCSIKEVDTPVSTTPPMARSVSTDPCGQLRTCSHKCEVKNGVAACTCPSGQSLGKDKVTCSENYKRKSKPRPNPTRTRTHKRPSTPDPCHPNRGNCSHKCNLKDGLVVCSCLEGHRLGEDNRTCIDIDECSDSRLNSCDHRCHNRIGSYGCSCFPGYVLKNRFNCEACRLNSYRSASDVGCIECPANSFTDSEGKSSAADCSCSPGFWGSPADGGPCVDIDECKSENFGCTHKCVNTPGSAHCSCPPGLELQDDFKTCVDIDECSLKNGGCEGLCHNTIGNFSCSCGEGYVASKTNRYSCDDVDECADNNGGCGSTCVNFKGGYYCACLEGYRLSVDGRTCIALLCPVVSVPHHSNLRCFSKESKNNKTIYQPGETPKEAPVHTLCRVKCAKGYEPTPSFRTAIECQSNGKWNATLAECMVLQCPPLIPPAFGNVHPPECMEGGTVKRFCYFTCQQGYRLDRRAVFKCKNDLTWNFQTFPSCVPELSTPFITCPDDVTVELLPDQSAANITLETPQTNMENFSISPSWVSVETPVLFPAGDTDVTFTATNPKVPGEMANCTLRIVVVDSVPPRFTACPESFSVNASVGGQAKYVQWEEPEVEDNVGLQTLLKNMEPNVTLSAGTHSVEYVARDLSGNIARCSFQISVLVSECADLKDPENGEANCMDWMFGKICEPTCDLNYTRGEDATQFYVCGESGMWNPNDLVSPCLPECAEDEVWLPDLEVCSPSK